MHIKARNHTLVSASVHVCLIQHLTQCLNFLPLVVQSKKKGAEENGGDVLMLYHVTNIALTNTEAKNAEARQKLSKLALRQAMRQSSSRKRKQEPKQHHSKTASQHKNPDKEQAKSSTIYPSSVS